MYLREHETTIGRCTSTRITILVFAGMPGLGEAKERAEAKSCRGGGRRLGRLNGGPLARANLASTLPYSKRVNRWVDAS